MAAITRRRRGRGPNIFPLLYSPAPAEVTAVVKSRDMRKEGRNRPQKHLRRARVILLSADRIIARRLCQRTRSRSAATERVLNAHNVVLAKIGPKLNFDDRERDQPRIAEPMDTTQWQVDGFALG